VPRRAPCWWAIRRCYQLVGATVEKPKPAYYWVNGTMVKKHVYVEGGNTRIWLKVDTGNGTVWVLAKVELLTPEEVLMLLEAEPGDYISVKVDEEYVVLEVVEVSHE